MDTHQDTRCPVCKWDFRNASALIDHYQWYDKSTKSADPSEQLLSLQYISLAPHEHDSNLQYLWARCHPLSRLLRQKFVMSTVPVKKVRLAGVGTPTTATAKSNLVKNGIVQREMGQGGWEKTFHANETKAQTRHTLPPEAFQVTPQRLSNKGHGRRKAVALDCEMVETTARHSDLAYLGAVDFLTGEVLIDSFVEPTDEVIYWRSRISGITPSNMREAVQSGKALRGWQAARDKLWEYIDDQTVLVGHALQNDLQVLGIIHHRIVDSIVLTAEAVFDTIKSDEKLPRLWGLKTLTKALLGQEIQNSKKGHNALQDAYAARDIVICGIRTPEILNKWALEAREVEERKRQERERKLRERLKKQEEALKEQIGAMKAQDQAAAHAGLVRIFTMALTIPSQ